MAPNREGADRTALAAAVAVLALAFLFSANQVWDSDSWFHLATGREILAHGIPAVNTFSFAFPDHPWPDPEWLFQLAAYLFTLPAGPGGAVLLQMALAGGAFLLSAGVFLRRAGRVGGRELLVLFPLVLLALAEVRVRLVLRPHLVSYLGIALLLYLWSARPKRTPLWFFLAGAVWANAHPGVVFGALLCGLFIGSALLGRDREGAGAACLAGAAFLGGSLCNPFFAYPYAYSLGHLAPGSVLGNIGEMAPPALAQHPAFFLFALLALAAIPFRLREGDWLHPLVATVFFAVAFRAQREVPAFCVAALPGTLLGLRQALGARSFARARGAPALAAAFLVAAFALFAAWRGAVDYRLFLRPGVGVNRAALPVGAARFIREKGFTGRFYNDVGNGGYLIWALYPGRGVFQDGRFFAYPTRFLAEAQGTGRPLDSRALAALAARYRLDGAVVTRALSPYFESYAGLFASLGWSVVYLDGVSCVFVRPGSPDAERAAGSEYSLLPAILTPATDPRDLFEAGSREPERMRSELERVPPGGLLKPSDCLALALAAWGAGDLPRAEAFFARGADLDPRSSGFPYYLGRLAAAAGKPELARERFRQAVQRGSRKTVGDEPAWMAAEELRRMGAAAR